MGSTQVRVATPSRCTVHAPHWAMPQPNLVPVRPSVSRSTQRSGVSGATSTVSRLPLTVKEIGGMTNFPQQGNGEQRALASREREGGMPASSCAETVRPIPEFLLQRRLADCTENAGLEHYRNSAGRIIFSPRALPVPRPSSLFPPMTTYARRLGIFSATMAVIGAIIGSGVLLGPAVGAA